MSRRHTLLLATPLVALVACGQPLTPPESAAGDMPDLHGAGAGGAAVRTTWPSDTDKGPPYYVRIDPVAPHVYHDGEWAAVVLYRGPHCIPADFNLLQFFDAPTAFGCPPTLSGASIWGEGAFIGAPKIATSAGTAVPIWFVPAAALLAEIEDGVLTFRELAAIPGILAGTASRFNETLHPHPLPPHLGGGGHPNPSIVINAHGTLDDGRRFQFQLNRDESGVKALRISFR